MMRRGLQFFAVLVLLGAASCYGQNYPGAFTLTDFDPYIYQQPTPVDINGYYVAVGTRQSGNTVFQKYGDIEQAVVYIEVGYTTGSTTPWQTTVRVSNGTFITVNSSLAAYPITPFTATGATWSGVGAGTIIPHAQPLSEYELAFPDWEAAAVKIPLGFTFAMSFWAAAVALAIGMKWVRDLASAAS